MTRLPAVPFGERVSPGSSDSRLLDYVVARGLRRVFLITGNGSFCLFQGKGFLDKLSEISTVARWAAVQPNPDFSILKQGVEALNQHDPDVIIGIGGGSVLDMAKLLAALHGKPSLDLETLTTGSLSLRTRKVHLVLIPTTAGSGAEATHFSVLYRNGVKYSVSGKALLPDHVFLDPTLVTGGEPLQLAASGLDALCQCIESIWAKGATSESQEIAREGLRAVSGSLIGFVNGGKGFAENLQWGSHLAGHAINTSKTTAPHALSYFLTARLGVPHGIAVASTLGYFADHHISALDSNHPSDRKISTALAIIGETLGWEPNVSTIEYFRVLFSQLGLDAPQEYWPPNRDSIDEWIRSANPERLANHPVALEQEDLYQILSLN